MNFKPRHTSVHDIPNGEYTKHHKRIEDLHNQAQKSVDEGKVDNYDKEATRLTGIQAKKITDPDKAYDRASIALEHGYYTIGNRFMSQFRFLTEPRKEKIKGLLADWLKEDDDIDKNN